MIPEGRLSQTQNRRWQIGKTDKQIAEEIGVGPVTFSRWKKARPQLYQRIKQSYHCEETLKELGMTLEKAKELIEAYKAEDPK